MAHVDTALTETSPMAPACTALADMLSVAPRGLRFALMLSCVLLSWAAGCKQGPESSPAPTKAERAPWFEDVAAAWGITSHHDSGHDGRYLFPESVAGRVCLLDYDDDGNMDIYFVQSVPFEKPGTK